MNNDDQRDYAEEAANAAEMQREAEEERKVRMHYLYRQIIKDTIDAAKMWENSTQATKEGKDDTAKSYARMWASKVADSKKNETDFRNLAGF